MREKYSLKMLNFLYFTLQTVTLCIFIFYMTSSFTQLYRMVGSLIFIDFLLIMTETILGLWCSCQVFHAEKKICLTIMNFVPILLLIEGGILSMLGAALLALATVMRFKVWRVI